VLASELFHLAGIIASVADRAESAGGPAAAPAFTIALRLHGMAAAAADNTHFAYELTVGPGGAVLTSDSAVGVAHGKAERGPRCHCASPWSSLYRWSL
jgi:hypothetical protein